MTFPFAYPSVLFLLCIPALLLYWVWRRHGREVALPWDHRNQRTGRGWGRTINVFESLPPLLLAVVILVLAGPQQIGEPRTKRVMTNIEFCVDVSGSMTASFGEGTRYDASMQAINEFLDYRDGDAFGLTFFSDITLKWVPLTTDTSAFACAPPFMDPTRPLPEGLGGGTMIGRALRECRKTLVEREEGDRMIVLISDGYSADLAGKDTELAQQLISDNIAMYGVHVADGDVPDEIVNIAQLTGGEVFQPGDMEGLKGVFQRIDKMQKTRLEKVAAETRDHFAPFCIVGLSLIGCSFLGLFGLRYTPW